MPPALVRVIRRTRLRLGLQWALEAATTLGLLWVLFATALVYLLKLEVVSFRTFWLHLLGWGLLPLAGALVSGLRPFPVRRVAKRLDLSHELHDRLGTALEFSRSPEPTEFMRAQIRETLGHIPALSPRRAVPLRWPRDIRPLALLLLCLGAVVLLRFPSRAMPPPAAPPPRAPGLAVDADEIEPYRALARQMERQAQEEKLPEVSRLAEEMNRLFDQIQKKELTRKELFARLAELEKRYFEGLEGDFEELLKKLRKMGGELKKEKLTRELGKNLQESKLKKAEKELQELAEKSRKLSRTDRQKLARSLDRSATQKMGSQVLEQQARKLEEQIRRLKRELQKKRSDAQARRRLQRRQRQLERLNRRRQQQARQGRQLERLNQELQQAASGLRNQLDDETMRALQQAARQAGQFSGEMNKMRLMSRAQGQLADLKELLRRLGKGGKGRKGRLQDFYARARFGKKGKGGTDGKKGLLLDPGGKSGTMVLPLPGSQTSPSPAPGQGPDTPDGQPADGIGNSTDPRLMGQATRLRARHRESMVRGAESKGPTHSEVILGAAEDGFSSRHYRRVYSKYNQVVEDVLKREEVPLGYRFFVKQYFHLIRPQ